MGVVVVASCFTSLCLFCLWCFDRARVLLLHLVFIVSYYCVVREQPSKSRKSKGKRLVTNLREAPYSFKDGDVVAVVDRMEDEDGQADLTRADDEVSFHHVHTYDIFFSFIYFYFYFYLSSLFLFFSVYESRCIRKIFRFFSYWVESDYCVSQDTK